MTKKVSQFEYKRADISAAAAAIKAAVEKVKSAKSGAELKAIRDGIQKLFADVSTAYCISEIRYTLNVKDEFYLAEKDYYDENMPNVSAAGVEFNKALLSSPYIDELKTLINPLIIDKARDGVPVLAVEMPDEPGSLFHILKLLGDGGVNLEYMYAFLTRKADTAYMVLRVENNEKAIEILSRKGIHTISQEALENL